MRILRQRQSTRQEKRAQQQCPRLTLEHISRHESKYIEIEKITTIGRCEFALKKNCCERKIRFLASAALQLSKCATETTVKLRSRRFIQNFFHTSPHCHGLQITHTFFDMVILIERLLHLCNLCSSSRPRKRKRGLLPRHCPLKCHTATAHEIRSWRVKFRSDTKTRRFTCCSRLTDESPSFGSVVTSSKTSMTYPCKTSPVTRYTSCTGMSKASLSGWQVLADLLARLLRQVACALLVCLIDPVVHPSARHSRRCWVLGRPRRTQVATSTAVDGEARKAAPLVVPLVHRLGHAADLRVPVERLVQLLGQVVRAQ